MIQSILYGNGINLLTKGMPSWDNLLKEISDVELDKDIPNTLKYEVLLTRKPYQEPNVFLVTNDGKRLITENGKLFYIPGELTEKKLKEGIAKRLSLFNSNKTYERISKLPVSHFITTNYDNALFYSLGRGVVDTRFREEKRYSIRRCYVINNIEGGNQFYWPIHGNIDSPSSIMLGYDHYCGSLAKITTYVKGGYDLHSKRLEELKKRLKGGIEEIISWIDLFFVSDIHILGLNLRYEETDLWWVLNRRKRIKQEHPELIKNKIIYYPVEEMTSDKQQLLLGFDVDVVHLEKDKLIRPFYERYNELLTIMDQNMQINTNR